VARPLARPSTCHTAHHSPAGSKERHCHGFVTREHVNCQRRPIIDNHCDNWPIDNDMKVNRAVFRGRRHQRPCTGIRAVPHVVPSRPRARARCLGTGAWAQSSVWRGFCADQLASSLGWNIRRVQPEEVGTGRSSDRPSHIVSRDRAAATDLRPCFKRDARNYTVRLHKYGRILYKLTVAACSSTQRMRSQRSAQIVYVQMV
jgi:hypothetical protein